MSIRQILALILIAPVVAIFWILTAIEILFYPYTATIVGLLANGRWVGFHEYLHDIIGIPFGG